MNQKQPVILPDGWEIIEGGLREDLPEVREWLAESQRQQYFPKGKDLGQQQQQQQQQRPMNSQERFDAFIQSQIQPREVDREGSLRLLQEAADNAPVPSTGIGNLVGGAFHGAANVGNHMLQAVKQPFRVSRAMFDPRYTMKDAGADWRRGIDEGAANDLAVLQRMPGGYDPSRDTAKATQWLGEAIASAPIGGGVAKVLGAGLNAAAPAVGRMAAPLLESMKTSGFGKMANGSIWNRMAGGAANSVASTAVVDPGSIGYDTAGLGAALPMIPVGARKVIAKSLNKWSAPTRTGPKFAQGDAKAMLDRGYKLTVGDIADSDNAKAFASQLNIIPWSGKAERKAHNQSLFDADVAKVVGANDLDEVRDGVIKARLDAKYDNFWNAKPKLVADQKFKDDLASLYIKADDVMAKDDAAVLKPMIAEIDEAFKASTNGKVFEANSEKIRNLRSNLSAKADAASEGQNKWLSKNLKDIRDQLDNLLAKNLGPEKAKEFRKTNRVYKQHEVIRDSLPGSDLGKAGNTSLTPQQLATGIDRRYGKDSQSLRGTELTNIARQANRFMVDRTPKTGGSEGSWWQNWVIGPMMHSVGGVSALVGGRKIMNDTELAKVIAGRGLDASDIKRLPFDITRLPLEKPLEKMGLGKLASSHKTKRLNTLRGLMLDSYDGEEDEYVQKARRKRSLLPSD